jgi:hypothetical protein
MQRQNNKHWREFQRLALANGRIELLYRRLGGQAAELRDNVVRLDIAIGVGRSFLFPIVSKHPFRSLYKFHHIDRVGK